MLTMLALVAGTAATSAPLTPSGKWQLDQRDRICRAAREFGQGSDAVGLLIERTPFGRATNIVLVAPKGLAKPGRSTLFATVDSDEPISEIAGVEEYDARRRMVSVTLPGSFLAGLTHAKTLTFSGSQVRAVTFALADMPALKRGFDACESMFAASLGVDAAAQARVAVAAEPVNEGKPIGDDHPVEALRADLQGTSYSFWRIDATGQPRDCRPLRETAVAPFDGAACAAIMKRALFKPARDSAGNPVDSYMSRRLVWRLP